MKEPYRWDYNIKIKTKEGDFEYEKESLENIDLLLTKHPDYTDHFIFNVIQPKIFED